MDTATATTREAPVPRRMDFPFEAIPRWWFAGKALPTHLANGLHLLFPAGERFFIRSVRYYLDEIEDETLRARVKGFFGQEGHHAREHQRFFEIMESQGLEIRSFLRWYERVAYQYIEKRFSPKMRLSTTVAAEHFTATFAENALGSDVLENAHPALQELLRWHAAEEIEHKSVAFDVLQAVDPSYRLRVQGLLVATATLLGFWMIATVMLMRQERLGATEILRQVREWRASGQTLDQTIRRAFREYLRRDFHPSQMANDHLAREYLERIGRVHG